MILIQYYSRRKR